MSLQSRYLDELAWVEALRDAQAGDMVRLEFKLRTSSTVPEDVRLWLADHVRLLGSPSPGRRAALAPALLMMERAGYERAPLGRRKVYVLEASERYGIDPESMRKMLKASPVKVIRRNKPA